jgi:hypothetical protein
MNLAKNPIFVCINELKAENKALKEKHYLP